LTKLCQPPDPNPRGPRLQAPPGATDTHFHIFGPEGRYPFLEDRRFTPPDASVSSYLHLHRTLSLSRAVLVQASMYGADNRRQLDAAKEMDIPTRVIVVVQVSATDQELTDLHKQGARGVIHPAARPSV
jgi:predicted TIM-barrel fold metal-dependent hydrolase